MQIKQTGRKNDNEKNLLLTALTLFTAFSLSACGSSSGAVSETTAASAAATDLDLETADSEDGNTESAAQQELPDIYLRLGETDDRPSYEIALEDNEVSVRFVRILQEYTRVIPLYVFDGSENTDVLQFYDIPASYDIPDGEPTIVTSEKAGEVYYSEGRIMIFYQDAEIEGNYVKIGETLTTEGLADAVNSNPLDEWGNRRVTIGIVDR